MTEDKKIDLKKILFRGTGTLADFITILLFIFDQKKYAFLILIIVLIIIFIDTILVIVPIFNIKRAKRRLAKKYYSKGERIGACLHRYNHKLRDYISNISSEQKGIDNKTWNRLGELLCDSISDIYKEIFCDYLAEGQNISVCIKTVKANSLLDTDYMNWKLETFSRSPATGPERTTQNDNEILISENSDFQIIISEEFSDKYVAFTDMRNISDSFLNKYKIEYKNSRADFLNYYCSCIIIPIEIDGNNSSLELKNKLTNVKKRKLLLGFLCIDSLKVFSTDEEIKAFEMGVSIAKAIGDSLYPFYEQILLNNSVDLLV